MKTMTIRKIPDEVADYISNRAAEEGRSINAMTVAILARASGRSSDGKWGTFPWPTGPKGTAGNAVRDNGLGKFRGTLSRRTGDDLLKFVSEADFSKVDREDL